MIHSFLSNMLYLCSLVHTGHESRSATRCSLWVRSLGHGRYDQLVDDRPGWLADHEQDASRYVLWRLEVLWWWGRVEGPEEVGPHTSGDHGHDPDAVFLSFLVQRLRQAHDAVLGGRVGGGVGPAFFGGGRGDVDDLAPSALDHVREDGAGEGPRGAEVDVLDAVPLGQGQLGGRPDEVHPGVVDEYVYAALGVEDVVHPRPDPGDLGDVQVDLTSPDLLGDLPRAFLVDVRADDARPVRREHACGRGPEPARRPGHQRDLVVKIEVDSVPVHLFSFLSRSVPSGSALRPLSHHGGIPLARRRPGHRKSTKEDLMPFDPTKPLCPAAKTAVAGCP